MRMFLSFSVCIVFAPSFCAGEKDKTLLDPKGGVAPVLDPETQPHKMLYTYLLKEAQKHFDARRTALEKLRTLDEIDRRNADLKAKFIAALGDFPDKTPLNAKVTGVIKADGYRAEKVIFESRPEHHVTGILYIPDGKGPFPGVLIPCGHSANGKAAEAYQAASVIMAKNGMVAFCYDPIGQGERIQVLNAMGKPAIAGSTSEHTQIGIGALLVGRCAANYRIWDGLRAMDYLASRPEVDPKKLGCTGNSGGGTMTAYLMIVDDRIACAAPSCYITSFEKLFATLGPQDAEQNIPGQVAFGFEHSDFLMLRAPKPTLMAVGTYDFFNIDGAWSTFREAHMMYTKLGYPERVSLMEYPDKHGWSKPRREATMRWMRRWLLGVNDAPFEEPFTARKDEELQCTRSGQVLQDFRGVSAFHLNMARDKELAAARAKFVTLPRPEQETTVRRLLAIPAARKLTALSKMGEDELGVRFVAHADEGLQLPGLKIRGTAHKPSKKLIYLDDRGWAAEAGKSGRLKALAKDYDWIVAVDVRGLGETAPGKSKSAKPAYFGVDMKDAFLAMHLGRPLLGQRLADLLRHCPDAKIPDLSSDSTDETYVLAHGPVSSLVALHAAALNPKIAGVTLENCLLSYSNVVHTPLSYNQLTNVIPGVLMHYDLPELATMIAPRPLTVRDAVDAQLEPVSQKTLEATWARAADHYQKMGKKTGLVLQGGK